MDLLTRLKVLLSPLFTPTRIFILSFAGVIILGALLLWLPFSAGKAPLTFIDALFTSTSAVCVTGLASIDLSKDLSFPGQIICLILLQIGGLGIITFSVVFFGIMGRGISFKEREIVQSTFLHSPRRDFLPIMKWVLLATFIIEGLGTLLLFLRFSFDLPAKHAFFQAIYHAVSAFNNCGYSLFTNNLVNYRDDWTVTLTVMGLIILGGIGFIVQYEVTSLIRGRIKKLSIHSRIVLITTGILIVGGTACFYLFEMNALLRDASCKTSFLASAFHSVSARTSGFNTVDIGQLTNATILILVILMFIGASPGSTGGGIKTTSFALLIFMIWTRIKGQEEVNIFNRTIPKEILSRTIAIIFASAFSVCLITSILLLLAGTAEAPLQSRHFFVEYLFETVSAFGTVGLSMGITANLNDLQKLAIILIMFAGRVGPLTLAFAWSAPKKGITYAEEQVMVG
ncbi:MAG: trk/ktr system potassium uptake protein [Thermodesulfobacteriota bacterium]|nr:trk/ktr system potassium uptake protein [Thermodesulfobacteriota bacterium]